MGLFKALANDNGSSNGHGNNAGVVGEGEEQQTRHTVRSNFSSREIFEHPSRPSLDDLHIPAISYKATRGSCYIVLQQYEERFAAEPLALHQDVLSRLMGLPDSMAASIKAAHLTHAELVAHTVTKADFEDVRSMMTTNSDLQVQLANLARLKTSNVTIESLLGLEKLDRELNADKQAPVSKSRLEDLRRANEQLEQLAALVSQVQMNEPELEDAQLAHEQAEDRAAQLKLE
ncbi:hypothetical protein EDB84DRAFT_1679591 [Lactarius hengduanensis]|nr:hypothetical protein EDB84DRAFT_1679591 [Lactarius hengduanensis]